MGGISFVTKGRLCKLDAGSRTDNRRVGLKVNIIKATKKINIKQVSIRKINLARLSEKKINLKKVSLTKVNLKKVSKSINIKKVN